MEDNQKQNKSVVKYIFYLGLLFSLIINITRADYNIIFYVFSLYAWEYSSNLQENENLKQRLLTFYISIPTLLWDLFTSITWWNIVQNDVVKNNHASKLSKFFIELSLYLAFLLIIIKLIFIILVGLIEKDKLKQNLPTLLQERLYGLEKSTTINQTNQSQSNFQTNNTNSNLMTSQRSQQKGNNVKFKN